MRALVTGCARFIGSHLTESLLEDGHAVLGVDCFTDNYERSRKLANLEQAREFNGFELAPVDLAEAELRALVDGCDAVFQLAGEPGGPHELGRALRAVPAPQRDGDAAPARGGGRGARDPVRLRVLVVDLRGLGEPADARGRPCPAVLPVRRDEARGREPLPVYHANHGVRTVALRYFTVFGPRQRPDMAFHRFCRAAVRGEPLTVFGDGRQTRDFTLVVADS